MHVRILSMKMMRGSDWARAVYLCPLLITCNYTIEVPTRHGRCMRCSRCVERDLRLQILWSHRWPTAHTANKNKSACDMCTMHKQILIIWIAVKCVPFIRSPQHLRSVHVKQVCSKSIQPIQTNWISITDYSYYVLHLLLQLHATLDTRCVPFGASDNKKPIYVLRLLPQIMCWICATLRQ